MDFLEGKWTNSEHSLFEDGIVRFGWGRWREISEVIPSRTRTQVKAHAQKFQKYHPDQKEDLVELHNCYSDVSDAQDRSLASKRRSKWAAAKKTKGASEPSLARSPSLPKSGRVEPVRVDLSAISAKGASAAAPRRQSNGPVRLSNGVFIAPSPSKSPRVCYQGDKIGILYTSGRPSQSPVTPLKHAPVTTSAGTFVPTSVGSSASNSVGICADTCFSNALVTPCKESQFEFDHLPSSLTEFVQPPTTPLVCTPKHDDQLSSFIEENIHANFLERADESLCQSRLTTDVDEDLISFKSFWLGTAEKEENSNPSTIPALSEGFIELERTRQILSSAHIDCSVYRNLRNVLSSADDMEFDSLANSLKNRTEFNNANMTTPLILKVDNGEFAEDTPTGMLSTVARNRIKQLANVHEKMKWWTKPSITCQEITYSMEFKNLVVISLIHLDMDNEYIHRIPSNCLEEDDIFSVTLKLCAIWKRVVRIAKSCNFGDDADQRLIEIIQEIIEMMH